MTSLLRAALVFFLLLTTLTGGVYPLVVTLLAQGAFPLARNGSVVEHKGKAIGSELIGQPFQRAALFLGPAVRDDERRQGFPLQCGFVERIQSWPD